jgi:geranylgeranyl pyrophosphate synthase
VTAPTPTRPIFRTAIAERITTRQEQLAEASRHLLEAAGKGVRPACVRLIGCAMSKQGRTDERHENLADAIELLHVGSLIHDDILDDADVRRGVRSVHVGWDAKVAVLAGDYLLARASQLVAELGEPAITKRLAEVMAELCEGELMQDEQLFDLDLGFDAYLERVAKKAASPFELACEGAAILSGAYGRDAAVARRLGFHLGRLFQLVDDWLDWNVDAQTLGKPAGRDLLAGSITLPVLVALQHPEVGPRLRELLTPFPQELPAEVERLLARPDVRDYATKLVREEGERARRWLLELPANAYRDEMEALLNQLIARVNAAEVPA